MIRFIFLCCLILKTSVGMGQMKKWNISVRSGIGRSGIHELQDQDLLTSDQYQQGMSLSGGIRLGYKFSNYLMFVAGAEWEKIEDRRVRSAIFTNVQTDQGVFSYTNTYYYRNKFSRLQAPVSLHFYPLPNKAKAYIVAGIMPVKIYSGTITSTGFSTNPDETTVEKKNLKADFDIPFNQGQDRRWIYLSGVGFEFSNRISAELIYRFNKPVQYMIFDPGQTMIGVPIYTIRANQGIRLSVQVRLN